MSDPSHEGFPDFPLSHSSAEDNSFPLAALPLGQIGPYRIVSQLGAGGMGTVFKAVHTRLKKAVAIKTLRCASDAQAKARFERETEAAGSLEHPHIVQTTDAGIQGDVHYLVMEHLEGSDLSALARRHGRLPLAEACEIIRQAAVGLEHVHQHHLVHRDIKPSNLMLSSTGQVKILDLGLVRMGALTSESHDDLTETNQALGTIDYMAPEQALDSHQVDSRADLYSLGATLYKLLCGEAPLVGCEKRNTLMMKLRALAVTPPVPLRDRRADVPEPLAAIVHRLLAKAPEERFATAAELAMALEPFAAGASLRRLLDESPLSGPEHETAAVAVITDGPDSLATLSKLAESNETSSTEQLKRAEAAPLSVPAARLADAPRRGTLRILVRIAAMAVAALVVIVACVFADVFYGEGGEPTPIVKVPPPVQPQPPSPPDNNSSTQDFSSPDVPDHEHTGAHEEGPERSKEPVTTSGLHPRLFSAPTWLMPSPDGKRVNIGLLDVFPTAIELSSGAGTLLSPLSLMQLKTACWAAITPDGKRAITMEADAKTGDVSTYLWEIDRGKPRCLLDHAGTRFSALSPDGKWLATCGAEDGLVSTFTVERYRHLVPVRRRHYLKLHHEVEQIIDVDSRPFDPNSISPCMAFLRGDRLAVLSFDETLSVLHLQEDMLQPIARVKLGAKGPTPRGLTASADGQQLCVFDSDEIILYAVGDDSLKEQQRIPIHKNDDDISICCAAFLPFEKTLITGHRDRVLRMWSVSNGKLVQRDFLPTQASLASPSASLFSHDGQ